MLASIGILFCVVVKYIGNNPGSIKSNNVALCSSCSGDKDQVLNVKRSCGEVYEYRHLTVGEILPLFVMILVVYRSTSFINKY